MEVRVYGTDRQVELSELDRLQEVLKFKWTTQLPEHLVIIIISTRLEIN